MGEVSILGRTRDDRGDVGNAIASYQASDGQTYIGLLRRFAGGGFAFVEVYQAGPWALVGEANIRQQYPNADIQPALTLIRSRTSGTIIALVTDGAGGARNILRCDTGVAVPPPNEAGAAPTNEQVASALAALVASGAITLGDTMTEQEVSAAINAALSPFRDQLNTIADSVNRLGQWQPTPAPVEIDYGKLAEAVFAMPPVEGGLGMPDEAQMGTRFQQFLMYCLTSPYHMRPVVRALSAAVEHEVAAQAIK